MSAVRSCGWRFSRIAASMASSRACRAVALASALAVVGIAPAPSGAGQIDIGDFGPAKQTTTFDGLGLPFSNSAPLVIDGHTFTSNDGMLRYVSFSCAANQCIADNGSQGFIDVVLAEPALKAGAFVSGIIGGWIILVDFFDADDVLLGSVFLANGPAFTPLFAGWEDPGGIARIRFNHLFTVGIIFTLDDLSVEHVLPVEIDITPGGDPNPVISMRPGVTPVGILGSDILDVLDVDPTTLAFGPAGAPLAHQNALHFEDDDGGPLDLNDDGFNDALAHFLREESGIALGDMEACLTGELLDGRLFEGCDDIIVISCGLGFEIVFLLPPLVLLRQRRRRIARARRGHSARS